VGLFYRRVDVVGLERIPARGPLIIAPSHNNALVDGLLLLAKAPRPLMPVAKAPLFHHPLIGPFLKLVGAVPVHRRQDAGEDPARNLAMFSAVADALRGGGAILIFPEGVSQPEPTLMPVRTGAARMLLAARAQGSQPVTLLPVGLLFHEPGTFRAGWALVVFGDPVPSEDCVTQAARAPQEAARRLTERLAEALRRLIVEVEDRHTLRLVEHAEAVWREERPEGARDPAARAEWRQRAARAYRYLSAREPERIAALRRQLERYVKDLESAGLTGQQLAETYPPRVVAGYAFSQATALLVGLPLAFWGLVNHAPAYWLTALAARLARPEPDTEATFKLAAALVLYPVVWVAEGWTAWRLGGGWLLAVFLVALLPTGFFALSWVERLGRVIREARGLFRFLVDRDLHRHLLARRRAIMEELTALLAMVPEPVLDGRGEERP
jgi:glycerol-3-phosphate O-acyltransferase / dihydroxyacetone phosphate acyltransferase